MCLIVFAYRIHPQYPLIVAANRDEFYRRPAAPATFWPDYPQVLAGTDLEHGGTWMGITRSGRFGAITNYRDPAAVRSNVRSRGALVRNFLIGTLSPTDYLAQAHAQRKDFNAFNLLVGSADELLYYSNRTGIIQSLAPGLYGLSNHLLDTPWPKVVAAKNALYNCLDIPTSDCLFALLANDQRPPDELLPTTGVSLDWERTLSSIFIQSPDYGTRCSTVLLQDQSGLVTFIERTLPSRQEVSIQFSLRQ